MNKEGMSQVAISDVIGFSQSTIGKELKRNGGLRGYRHKQAQGFATRRKESKDGPILC
jgi:IS30 family transposase